MISSALLKILTCPVNGKALKYDRENNELISEEAGLAYPIIDGDVPVLLPDQARKFLPIKPSLEDQQSNSDSDISKKNVA